MEERIRENSGESDGLLYLWLGMFPNITNMILNKMISSFGGVRELWEADEQLLRDRLTEKQCRYILESRDKEKIRSYEKKLSDRGILYVYPGHEQYPQRLLSIPDRPNLLYIKGRIDRVKELTAMEQYAIAVVGARKLSDYGRRNAGYFAGKLAKAGTVIVSGLAAGADSIAHQSALEAGGFTIAVLGCGINVCYPRENYQLFHEICKKGLVISEYGLDVEPLPYRFPHRNRIISGLSDGVLVVEAREKSGSLITADQALEQGKEVYAIPGKIYDENSRGCNNLIKQGAACVTSPGDICNAIGDDMKNTPFIDLSKEEQEVLAVLKGEAKRIDDICNELHKIPVDVIGILFDLEQKNLVKQDAFCCYRKRNF